MHPRSPGSGSVIAATVAIVLSAVSVLLCFLYPFVLPGATDRGASIGWRQEQASNTAPADNPSGNSNSQYSGSTTGQDASASGAPKNSPTEGERDPGYYTGFHEPFWGVWTFASKSASEAMERATFMTNEGFDSTIELTTNWSNLNDEKWYVVTTGMWRDEGEAQSMVSTLRTAGYSDAYAKYSGEYVGNET